MTTMLFSAIFPLGFYFLSWIPGKMQNKRENSKTNQDERENKKNTENQFSKALAITLFIEWGVFLLLSIISEHFLFNDGNKIPVLMLLLAAALPFGAVLARYHLSDKRIAKFLKKTAICAVALMIAEVVLFNGKSFTDGSTDEIIGTNVMTTEGTAEFSGSDIIISGDASVILSDVPDQTEALILNMNQEVRDDSLPFNVELSIKDDNLSNNYVIVQDKFTKAYDHDLTFSFSPYGEIHELKISFNSVTKPITFHSIRAVSAIPFEFSVIRYLVLFALAMLLIAVKEFKLYKITYQNKKPAHAALVWGMILLCTFSAVFFFRPGQELVEYDSTRIRTEDPYSTVFDAFQKGQVHLDYAADPGLEEIENVYDYSQRQETDIFALWDYAYYEGNYYVYFGAAPVVACYYPFYLITGKLPTLAIANAFFGVLAILFLCKTILAAMRLLVPRPNLLLLLASMPAAVCCVGIYTILNIADVYTLPLASGLCFLFLCLWMGLGACSIRKKTLKLTMLFLSGLSLALCVASRPGIALGSAVLIPFFLSILINKKQKLSFRLGQACSFAVPLFIGGCAVMWYNHARFGSPFDFGAAYQLTVSDIHANKTRISDFPAMLYHYFFQFPRPKQSFPFFEPQFFMLNNYGSYTYVSDAVGALSYPMVLLGTAMIPVFVRKRGNGIVNGVTNLQRNAFIIICFVMALFLGWQNFCLGGVNQRYVIDLMPLLVIGSIVAILRSAGNPLKNKYRYIVSGVSMAATFCLGWLLVIGSREGNLTKQCPNLYDILEDLLIFWQ